MMFQMLIVLILVYVQAIYSCNITVDINSSDIPEECLLDYKYDRFLSKSEVLSNTDYKARQYYCNQDTDTCVCTGKEKQVSYVKLKDKNGNFRNYIAATCPYPYNVTRCYGKEFRLENSDDYVYCSHKCTKDSDCLYNKCINNVCVYRENSSMLHCVDIYHRVYKYFDRTYVHCGKPDYELCSTDEECSGEVCSVPYTVCTTEECSNENHNLYCMFYYIDDWGIKGNDNILIKFITICFILIPIIIFIIICVYSYRAYHNKKH